MKLIISEIQFNRILSEQNYGQVSDNFKEMFNYKLRINNEIISRILISALINTLKETKDFKLSNLNNNTNDYARKILFNNNLMDQIGYIKDYLDNLDREKLYNYSNQFRNSNLSKLYDISDNWHKSLESKTSTKEFGDKIIIDYRKNGIGYYWIYTNVGRSCEKEAELMGHCGSSRSGYHISLHSQDVNGNIDGHVTIDMDIEDGENHQTYGKGNSEDIDKYYDYVEDLYEKFHLNPFRCQKHLRKTFLRHGYLQKKITDDDFIPYITEDSLYDVLEYIRKPIPTIIKILSNDEFVAGLEDSVIGNLLIYFNSFDELIDILLSSQSFIENISERTLRFILRYANEEKIETYVDKFIDNNKFIENSSVDELIILFYYSDQTEKIMNKIMNGGYFTIINFNWFYISKILDLEESKRNIIIDKLLDPKFDFIYNNKDIISTVNFKAKKSESLKNKLMTNKIYVKYFLPYLDRNINELKLGNIVKKIITEKIRAHEAYDNLSSLLTIANEKRGVGHISLPNNETGRKMKEIIRNRNDIHLFKIPNPDYDNVYIVFRDGYENDARELLNIAKKYDGYLSIDASEEDTIRIGKLLGYEDEDIMDFINKQKVNVST